MIIIQILVKGEEKVSKDDSLKVISHRSTLTISWCFFALPDKVSVLINYFLNVHTSLIVEFDLFHCFFVMKRVRNL